MNWVDEKTGLLEKISHNVFEHFKLRNDDQITLFDCQFSVSGAMDELKHKLELHKNEPFTVTRLKELANLGESEKLQYTEDHGRDYLSALIYLAQVTSTSCVFEDFDSIINSRKVHKEINLVPLDWEGLDKLAVQDFESIKNANALALNDFIGEFEAANFDSDPGENYDIEEATDEYLEPLDLSEVCIAGPPKKQAKYRDLTTDMDLVETSEPSGDKPQQKCELELTEMLEK